MGRCLQTDIPQPKRVFTPNWPYLTSFHERMRSRSDSRKQSMTGVTEPDHCHHFQMMSQFGCELKTNRSRGESSNQRPHRGPTSETLSGIVRRNQSHLSPRPGEERSDTITTEPPQRTIATWSQTGTHIRPSSRLT